MPDIGNTKAKRVNAQQVEINIGSSSFSDRWLHVQEFTLPIGSPAFMEPTTLGSVTPFDGTPRNKLTGTLVYSQESWADATAGWTVLLAKTNQERPIFTLKIRFTAADGATNILTYTSGAQMEFITPSRGAEGAVKATFSIILFVDQVVS